MGALLWDHGAMGSGRAGRAEEGGGHALGPFKSELIEERRAAKGMEL